MHIHAWQIGVLIAWVTISLTVGALLIRRGRRRA